jgi:protein-tyrosine phosphatase
MPATHSTRGIVPALAFLVSIASAGCDSQPDGGTITPDRHVALDGQANFRDIGGYVTADGRVVRWGQVYRSGRLDRLTADDVARIDSLGIRTVVNFLTPAETAEGPDRLPDTVREILLPIVSGNAEELTTAATYAIGTGDFSRMPPTINPEIHRLLVTEAEMEYAALLRAAADPGNRPLVLHCTHGVHRTGTATAVLLSALGVPWETVREDYLLSNVYRAAEVEHRLGQLRQAAATTQGIAPDEVDMAAANAFFVLDGTYIDASLDEAVRGYGSMQAYIRDGLGVSDDEIAQLRTSLLEDGS